MAHISTVIFIRYTNIREQKCHNGLHQPPTTSHDINADNISRAGDEFASQRNLDNSIVLYQVKSRRHGTSRY